MPKFLTREMAVSWWVSFAIDDFVIQFTALSKWNGYQPFFLAQGLEKILKAFVIGIEHDKFKDLYFEPAKHIVDKIARDLKHDLRVIITKVQAHIDLKEELASSYDGYSGHEIIKILQVAYEESRYPVPVSISHKYPIKNYKGFYWDPMMSSGLEKFTFSIALKILLSIENDFSIKISRENIRKPKVSDSDWRRFSNLFFKDK